MPHELQPQLDRIMTVLDENTRTVHDLHTKLEVMQVDVGYVKKEQKAKAEEEDRRAQLRRSRMWSIVMVFLSTGIGAAAAAFSGLFEGGPNGQ